MRSLGSVFIGLRRTGIEVEQVLLAVFITNIKVEGETKPIGDKPLTAADARQLAYSIMNDEQVADYEENLELNMALSIAGLDTHSYPLIQKR